MYKIELITYVNNAELHGNHSSIFHSDVKLFISIVRVEAGVVGRDEDAG